MRNIISLSLPISLFNFQRPICYFHPSLPDDFYYITRCLMFCQQLYLIFLKCIFKISNFNLLNFDFIIAHLLRQGVFYHNYKFVYLDFLLYIDIILYLLLIASYFFNLIILTHMVKYPILCMYLSILFIFINNIFQLSNKDNA